MPVWNQYRCPHCSGKAWRGDPRTGIKFRGSARCDDCGKGFAAVGLEPVDAVLWPDPEPTPQMLEARKKSQAVDRWLGAQQTAAFDDRFEALHPRGSGGRFLSAAALVGDVNARVEQALSTGVSADRATLYRNTMRGVLSNCSAGALKLIRDRVVRWHFHEDLDALKAEHQRLGGKPTQGHVGGFVYDRGVYDHDPGKGEVHLDGGHDAGDDYKRVTGQIYRHEIAHVLDGVGVKGPWLSAEPLWKEAWSGEIDGPHGVVPLSVMAQGNPREGFAEFGRLVLTDRKLAMRKYPRCWAFWKQKHLV